LDYSAVAVDDNLTDAQHFVPYNTATQDPHQTPFPVKTIPSLTKRQSRY
jgi:hypothetical protein